MFPLFVPIKKPEKTEKTINEDVTSRSQRLMGFAMSFLTLPQAGPYQILRLASPWVPAHFS